jgi:hypothetical protein
LNKFIFYSSFHVYVVVIQIQFVSGYCFYLPANFLSINRLGCWKSKEVSQKKINSLRTREGTRRRGEKTSTTKVTITLRLSSSTRASAQKLSRDYTTTNTGGGQKPVYATITNDWSHPERKKKKSTTGR